MNSTLEIAVALYITMKVAIWVNENTEGNVPKPLMYLLASVTVITAGASVLIPWVLGSGLLEPSPHSH